MHWPWVQTFQIIEFHANRNSLQNSCMTLQISTLGLVILLSPLWPYSIQNLKLCDFFRLNSLTLVEIRYWIFASPQISTGTPADRCVRHICFFFNKLKHHSRNSRQNLFLRLQNHFLVAEFRPYFLQKPETLWFLERSATLVHWS